MDRLAQKFVIRHLRPLRAAGAHTIKRKLNRVQQRRLPAPVDAAEQHDRQMPPIVPPRPQIKRLLPGKQAKVAERELFEDHARYPRPDPGPTPPAPFTDRLTI